MSIVHGSAVLRWLARAAAVIGAVFRESIFGKAAAFCTRGRLSNWITGGAVYRFLFVDGLIARALGAVGRAVKGSVLFEFCWRDGCLEGCWKQSVLCAALTGLANLPGAVLCRLRQKAGTTWEGSTLLRWGSNLGARAYLLLGLLLLMTMVFDHSKWNNMYALLGVFAVCVLFSLGMTARAGLRFDVAALGPYVILNLAAICLSVAGSLEVGTSLRFFVFQVIAFLILLLVVSSVENYRQLQLLVVLLMIGITAAALYGCYQGIVGVKVSAAQTDLSLNQGMPGRIYSFFDNPNACAGMFVMATPLTFALILNAKTWPGRAAALFSLAVCAAALAQTYSRAGWIGFVAAVLVFVLFWNWRCIPALFVVALCCLPVLPESIYNRILTIGNSEDSSTNYRLSIYQATLRLLKTYWLKGVGLGSNVLHSAFTLFPPMENGAYPVHTHNIYLQIWAETGLAGIVTFLAAMLYQFKRALKAYVSLADRRVKWMLAAAVSGICGIMVMGLAEYVWFYTRSLFLFWFVFAVVAVCVKLARRTEE